MTVILASTHSNEQISVITSLLYLTGMTITSICIASDWNYRKSYFYGNMNTEKSLLKIFCIASIFSVFSFIAVSSFFSFRIAGITAFSIFLAGLNCFLFSAALDFHRKDKRNSDVDRSNVILTGICVMFYTASNIIATISIATSAFT